MFVCCPPRRRQLPPICAPDTCFAYIPPVGRDQIVDESIVGNMMCTDDLPPPPPPPGA